MSKDKSSFWGHIKEIPNIGVDNFTLYNKRAYFLSHFHADHTVGLNSKRFFENLKQTNAKVYMSEITSVIVDYEYCGNEMRNDLQKYITPLKIGSTTITLPGNNEDDDEFLQVKVIPAGHSLGSVMFLFKYKDKTILYTGDFRIKPDNLPDYGQFHVNNEPIKIDVIYLDTTFQDLSHNKFPSRKQSVEKIIELIKNWLKAEGNRVAMFARTKYAYEFVFNEIYKQLGIRVYVDDFKWNLYKKIPDQVKGVTNNGNENLIHLCPKSTNDHTNCFQNTSQANYLYIYMSAYKWSIDHDESPYVEEKGENNHSVCFSTHCSRSELIYFVNYFSPKDVIGFRNPYNGNCDIDHGDESSPKTVSEQYYDNRDIDCEDEHVEISRGTPKKVKHDVKLDSKVEKDRLRKSFDW